MRLLISILFLLFVSSSCYTGKQVTTKNGRTKVEQRHFFSKSHCQRKAKRIAHRRYRARVDNPGYGITSMTNARQRHR